MEELQDGNAAVAVPIDVTAQAQYQTQPVASPIIPTAQIPSVPQAAATEAETVPQPAQMPVDPSALAQDESVLARDKAEQAQAKAQLAILMHQYGVGEDNQPSEEEQRKFLHGYSWAGLIYSVIYYWAMGDWLFVFISLAVSIIFFLSPVLLILPIFARKRAYTKKNWRSFNEFHKSQKAWDRSSIYALILVIIVGLGAFYFIGPSLKNTVQQFTGDNSGQSVTQQLKDTVNQYKDLTGN